MTHGELRLLASDLDDTLVPGSLGKDWSDDLASRGVLQRRAWEAMAGTHRLVAAGEDVEAGRRVPIHVQAHFPGLQVHDFYEHREAQGRERRGVAVQETQVLVVALVDDEHERHPGDGADVSAGEGPAEAVPELRGPRELVVVDGQPRQEVLDVVGCVLEVDQDQLERREAIDAAEVPRPRRRRIPVAEAHEIDALPAPPRPVLDLLVQ